MVFHLEYSLILFSISFCTTYNVEYDIIYNDEIQLSRSRFIREGVEENLNATDTSKSVSENPFAGIDNENDLIWVDNALKDIAYYLRAHKFNEYDRRYEQNERQASKENYKAFPRPPLRSLHWEVHKYCEPSFLTCVDYLRKRIKNTGLRREDDTSIVVQEQQWNRSNHSEQINVVDAECRKMQASDNIRADPFEGPIERFQWRTTASYYMCWYTMNGVPNLEHIKEKCDNFAGCLDPEHGATNHDPRADDNKIFACSLYSFCPDPCCPQKHLANLFGCWEHPNNPCFASNLAGHRQCVAERSRNTDFRDIILNRWNVTCHCPLAGYEWDSRYGMCVDVDECLNEVHECDPDREACVNLQGSFECACRWGYSKKGSGCEASSALDIIRLQTVKINNITKLPLARSVVKKLFQLISSLQNNCSVINYNTFIICIIFNIFPFL